MKNVGVSCVLSICVVRDRCFAAAGSKLWQTDIRYEMFKLKTFYRAMHFSGKAAVLRSYIVRLSVCPSVCDA